jgi:hypothetical protein
MVMMVVARMSGSSFDEEGKGRENGDTMEQHEDRWCLVVHG